MPSLPVTAFIGSGTITRSLLSGLSKKGYPFQQIIVSNRSQEKLIRMADEFGVRIAKNNAEAVMNADIAILAIKPQFTKGVCEELSIVLKNKKPLIISLVSATQLKDISTWIAADNLAMIRTMTNTATAVGMGTTALFANNFVTPHQKTLAETFFNAAGSSFWVKQESDLNVFSPLVGCAPAYLFLLIEAIQKAAVARGIPEELARKIALETICGAAALAKQSNTPVEELRRQVTTPKGITESSLKPLLAGDYFQLFEKAFEEAEKRCNEIETALRNPGEQGQFSSAPAKRTFLTQTTIPKSKMPEREISGLTANSSDTTDKEHKSLPSTCSTRSKL